MQAAPYVFSAANDDINFYALNNAISLNNISEIILGGQTIYKQQMLSTDIPVSINPSYGSIAVANDTLLSAQTATLQAPLPTDAADDVMRIRYLIDGTCQKVGSSLARCTKYYTIGQSSTPVRSSDHTLADKTYLIPSYADTSYNVVVSINDSNVASGASTWTLLGNAIVFNNVIK